MFNAKILVARNQDIKKLLNEYNKCNLNPSKCAVQICQKPKCPLLCDPFDQPDRRTDRATNPLPPSPYLRARSPRLKSTRFHVDGGGREGHCHYAAQEREIRVCRVRADGPRTGSSDRTTWELKHWLQICLI